MIPIINIIIINDYDIGTICFRRNIFPDKFSFDSRLFLNLLINLSKLKTVHFS